MSQVCIIGASNIKHISLISLYTRFFDKNGIPYDIIYIDRYGIEEKTSAQNQYCFQAKEIKGRLSKIVAFLKFRAYTKAIIKKNNYELLITWQTTTAYLFADLLLRKYSNRYIVNIRDYVAEKKPLFRGLIKKIVSRSAMNAISSDGFRSFLPKGDYIRVNSINDDIIKHEVPEVPEERDHIPPYKIGFAGNCRYFRESFKLIDSLANDERFEIWFCGTNSEVLSKYADDNNVKNVRTLPSFSPEETIEIFKSFDIVNSAFGNDAMDNSTLMPIRLYTAISLHLPILVNEETQLGREVESGEVGFVIHSYNSLADTLYDYMMNLNWNTLSERCDKYINTARQQNEQFYCKLGVLTERLKDR